MVSPGLPPFVWSNHLKCHDVTKEGVLPTGFETSSQVLSGDLGVVDLAWRSFLHSQLLWTRRKVFSSDGLGRGLPRATDPAEVTGVASFTRQ